MNGKKTNIKNARVLTPKEMREIRESSYTPCFGSGILECPSGTENWQKIGELVQFAEGLRCDNQIFMCNGNVYSGSGATDKYIHQERCEDPYGSGSYEINCNDSEGFKDIDEVFYRAPDVVAGIRCGNTYRFCFGYSYEGGTTGGESGSGSGWGSGSGSGSGSGTWKECNGTENGESKNLL